MFAQPPAQPKTTARSVGTFLLLAVCLSVIALRATFTESPNVAGLNPAIDARMDFYSLCLSAALIFAFLAWLIASALTAHTCYRRAGIAVGLAVFALAAAVSVPFASNTRAALTDFVTLAAPVLMAVLLVHILDSTAKVKLLLAVIVAAGAANAWQCADQYFSGRDQMVRQYDEDPAGVLARVGIEPGGFQQKLFEQRLYSGTARGFFLTGNSAGSFFILAAFAAVALLIENLRKLRTDHLAGLRLIFTAAVTAAIVFGLILTRSKGAIGAASLAAIMFAVYALRPQKIAARRKLILTAALLLLVAAGLFIIWYGSSHATLPGGTSMLVRWQYWSGAAKMYAANSLTGVGPGNFSDFYTHYKPAAARETVRDPHNFILSLLSQYGPLGLAGFLAAIILPLYRVLSRSTGQVRQKQNSAQPAMGLYIAATVICTASLLLFRPIFMPTELAGQPTAVVLSVVLILYVTPAVIFAIALVLLLYRDTAVRFGNLAQAAIVCGLFAVLIHNLVDFAIFEPGILTAFWALLASLFVLAVPRPPVSDTAAPDAPRNADTDVPILQKGGIARKYTLTTLGFVAAAVVIAYVLIPVEISSRYIEQAKKAAGAGAYKAAHELLDAAAKADRLSPAPPYLQGALYAQEFEQHEPDIELLQAAEKSFRRAAARNSVNYKSFERLMEVYLALAKCDPGRREELLEKAYRAANEALQRYPGCGRLYFARGRVAEGLEMYEQALADYRKALAIEQAYREQFAQMFPGRDVFSRLGERQYRFAEQRIETLSRRLEEN